MVAGLLMDVPFQEYLIALKAWKLPDELDFVVSSTIHFLPVFNRIFQTKMETLKLRGIEIKKLKLSERFALFKLLIIPVLAGAINDIRFRAVSLELRAFRLNSTRTSLYSSYLKFIDHLIIYATLLLSAAVIIILN